MAMEVDTHLLKKSNAAFHARRIQFREATRLDLKQERLKKKYRPVNIAGDPTSSSTTPTAKVSYSGSTPHTSATAATEDHNGFRLPARILFSKEKVQLAWPQPRPIGPGLGNLGNTCFLNSVLQCLTYTPPLANFLLSNQHSNSCKTTNFCMMCLLEKHVMRCFDHTMNESIRPKLIVGRLRNIGKQFMIGRQEDSHEFARYLIDALQKSCLVGYDSKLDDRIKETTIVHQIFGGYFQSQVKCMQCGYESNTFEPFLDISLDIRGAESVQTAFRDYTKAEILTKSCQYKCDKCKKLVDARKQMTIYDAPKVLSIQLKRFGPTGHKINRHVHFGTKLEMNSVMSTNKEHPELSYSLYAVLVHAGGSCHSGHYYCYVKSSNGIWYSMNDSQVSVASLQSVMNQNAYMLFYTQDEKGAKSTKAANGVKAGTGLQNGSKPIKSVSTLLKRRKLDGDEIGAKVERSAILLKETKTSSTEVSNGTSILSKEERMRLKKEKKRAKKLARLQAKEGSPSPATVAPSTVMSSSLLPAPSADSPAPSKSPLADLDMALPVSTGRRSSLTQSTKPRSVWTVTENIPKSPVHAPVQTDHLRTKEPKRKFKDMEDAQDEAESPSSEDVGGPVKPRSVTQAIVVQHNEAAPSKREKLQALIARESEFKSAEVKNTILGEVKHMLGSKVSTWEEPSYEMTKAREEVLRSLKPKHHRPDAYDVDYDRGKVKKVKAKNVQDGIAVGAKVANKFQKEQDVRNIVKPKFKKNKKNMGKKIPNEL